MKQKRTKHIGEIPKKGTSWRHLSGEECVVFTTANINSNDDAVSPTVVYTNSKGDELTHPLDDWFVSFRPAINQQSINFAAMTSWVAALKILSGHLADLKSSTDNTPEAILIFENVEKRLADVLASGDSELRKLGLMKGDSGALSAFSDHPVSQLAAMHDALLRTQPAGSFGAVSTLFAEEVFHRDKPASPDSFYASLAKEYVNLLIHANLIDETNMLTELTKILSWKLHGFPEQ